MQPAFQTPSHSFLLCRVTLDILGQAVEIAVLHVLEFDSARKRMTVIVRLPNGKLRAYVKGADSAIMAVLHENNSEVDTQSLVEEPPLTTVAPVGASGSDQSAPESLRQGRPENTVLRFPRFGCRLLRVLAAAV